jgi:hypothetical protein
VGNGVNLEKLRKNKEALGKLVSYEMEITTSKKVQEIQND